MTTQELDAYTTEQDRLDQLEEARLLPIYQAQRKVLQGFCNWLNDNHPNGAQFRVLPKDRSQKPWIDVVMDAFECREETTEIELDANDAYLILHALYQKSLS